MSDMPSPRGRRTHGAYRSPEDAMREGYSLIALMNGIPSGFSIGVFDRLGVYVLVSYPRERT